MPVPKLLGLAYIKYDGRLLKTQSGAKLNPGGKSRQPVVGNQVHGYSEEVVPPSLECTVSVDESTSLQAFSDIEDATISFECDTGQTYVMRNAWLVDPPDLTNGGQGGGVALKFSALSCVEM